MRLSLTPRRMSMAKLILLKGVRFRAAGSVLVWSDPQPCGGWLDAVNTMMAVSSLA